MDVASAIHPAWALAPAIVTEGYSLEMTAKDRDALTIAAPQIAPDTPIAITFLPGETMDARIAAACHVRALGFEPMPHLSARRITSHDELAEMVARLPFADTLSVVRTGLMEAHGIKAIGIAGHPDGHPAMDTDGLWRTLDEKCAEITQRGMAPLIVTQFGFDAAPFLAWLKTLRARGIDVPVRIGVPGPAGIKTLLRFAAHCGVGASAAVMTKYGVSITKLLGTAGPDTLIDALAAGLATDHGPIRLHFYPFGGLERTVAWINDYSAKRAA
jgi:methylenetetrahydrofolate reductase (NADPH)